MDVAIRNLFGRNPKSDSIPFDEDFVEAMMNAILKHNIFQFDGKMYRQIRGTAMGTKMAPAYANLFLDELETRFLDQQLVKPLVWNRFIDDILCIWPGTESSLGTFLEELNQIHQTIKFTWSISNREATFLDLNIHKGERFRATGKLDCSLHLK